MDSYAQSNYNIEYHHVLKVPEVLILLRVEDSLVGDWFSASACWVS